MPKDHQAPHGSVPVLMGTGQGARGSDLFCQVEPGVWGQPE
jgi:hypothetical protein